MTKVTKHQKKFEDKYVYVVFQAHDYYDGGDDLMSLHRTKERAKAEVKRLIKEYSGNREDYFIDKLELED